jgi:ABC-2 type transport system permease protein
VKFVVIIVALALATVIRLARRRRRRSKEGDKSSIARSPRAGSDDRRVFGETGIVAGREIRERLRGRVFRGVTIVLFAVVAAAVAIPTIHSGSVTTQKVGVVGTPPAIVHELHTLAKTVGLPVDVVVLPDLATGRAQLGSGQLDMVVDGAEKIVVENPVSSSDTSAGARYVRSVSEVLGVQQAFAEAGLTPKQEAAVASAKPLPIESIKPAHKAHSTAEATALIGIILIFIVLTQYLTWTLMGVMEEKASRVVEVLLATLRPTQLLAGKVAGIGAVALAQAVLLFAFALVLAEILGSSLVQGAAPLVVGAIVVWLVLGYAFYSWVYAAAGSLAERQDQVQSLALPLSAPLIFGYIASLIGASSGSVSLLVKVLAYLPPTAPFAMPVLVGFGEATWWEFALSVSISIVCTVGVANVAARVYRTAVLRTGSRVRLRDLLPTLVR